MHAHLVLDHAVLNNTQMNLQAKECAKIRHFTALGIKSVSETHFSAISK